MGKASGTWALKTPSAPSVPNSQTQPRSEAGDASEFPFCPSPSVDGALYLLPRTSSTTPLLCCCPGHCASLVCLFLLSPRVRPKLTGIAFEAPELSLLRRAGIGAEQLPWTGGSQWEPGSSVSLSLFLPRLGGSPSSLHDHFLPANARRCDLPGTRP